MKIARFTFGASLRELLPRDKRSGTFDYVFNGPQSVKHLIESVGIPHTEIGLMKANGEKITLDYLVKNGDQVEVQPESFLDHRPAPVTEPRFVLDGHLGRLTSHLRMLGLDCLYHNDYADKELVQVCVDEGRVLLTRDRRLLMHKSIAQGYLLRSLDPQEQLSEVVQRYRLKGWIKPFQRCIRCNHPLEPVSKEDVIERLEPLTKLYFEEFHICPACQQIYWKGSHYERMQNLISRITDNT